MAAAQFGVGGDGQLALGAGGGVPVGAVGHRLGEDGLALPVGLLQGLVAGGQLVLGRGVVVVAAVSGGAGLGGGAQAGQAGVPGGGADLAQLVPDVPGGPGGLDGVGVAQVQQPAVRHAAHVRAVGRAEGGQGLVPGGPGVGGGRGRFGADRVGRVVVAGQFPPGADRRGPFLPLEAAGRVGGDRAERGGGPGRGVAAACSPIRSLRASISAAISATYAGVRGRRGRGPARDHGPDGSGTRAPSAVAEAGIEDGGDVAGSGQVPFGDGVGQDAGEVQGGQFGGAQGAPQPCDLVAKRGRWPGGRAPISRAR